MPKKAFLLVVFLTVIIGLFSRVYDWGVKYGMGSSSISGDDKEYNLHYDFDKIETSISSLGYLDLDSDKAKSGISQNFGAYISTMLTKKTDSVWLQSELLVQRYNFSYQFKGKTLNTNSLILHTAFGDTLNGSIKQTLDYITVPVLIKLKQEISADATGAHYGGAYIYFGPSVSMLINNQTDKFKGIKALDDDVAEFVAMSYSDSNPSQAYVSTQKESASDKVLMHKTDFVFGLGFCLNDIFNMGVGKDEFVIDCRFDTGLFPIGDAATKTKFKLYSIILSLGVKL